MNTQVFLGKCSDYTAVIYDCPIEADSVTQDQTVTPGMVVNNNPFFLNISGGTNTVYGHVDKVEIKNGRSDVDE